MKMIYPMISVIILFGLTSCASNIGLTYKTQPLGAMVSFIDGRQIGETPAKLYYKWDEKYVRNGCLHIKGFTAKWVSGAQATSPETLRVCNSSGDFEYTLARPTDAPGLEKDMNYAMQTQQLRLQQQQAQSYSNERSSDQLNDLANSLGQLLGRSLAK